MSIFAGIQKQTSNNDSNFLTEGVYQLSLLSCRQVDSKKSNNQFFVVEGTVTSAEGDNPTAVGEEVAWVLKMGGEYPESALKDINTFLKSATGADDSDIDEEFVLDIIEDDGKQLVGLPVRVVVRNKITRKGNTYSKHFWKSPIQEDEVPF